MKVHDMTDLRSPVVRCHLCPVLSTLLCYCGAIEKAASTDILLQHIDESVGMKIGLRSRYRRHVFAEGNATRVTVLGEIVPELRVYLNCLRKNLFDPEQAVTLDGAHEGKRLIVTTTISVIRICHHPPFFTYHLANSVHNLDVAAI